MSAAQTHILRAGSCQGHCRAQRFDLNAYLGSSPTERKATAAAIMGWDNPDLQVRLEEKWQECCNKPRTDTGSELDPRSDRDINIDEWTGPNHYMSRTTEQVELAELKMKNEDGYVSPSTFLWAPRAKTSCSRCGIGGAPSHL